MPTTIIYITRHGQTEWNTQKRFQGHQDSPLTELGAKQAVWLGESLKDVPIDLICASSSPRAVSTAEIIKGDRNIPIKRSDALKEINLGAWEGITQEEARSRDPLPYDRFWNDPESFEVEGGETFRQVAERAISELRDIQRMNVGKSILIVTHTVVVKLLMAYYENRPLRNLWDLPYIHPTCLCKIEIDQDNHEIVLHGDTSHYQEQVAES